jgi:hypothetical protein
MRLLAQVRERTSIASWLGRLVGRFTVTAIAVGIAAIIAGSSGSTMSKHHGLAMGECAPMSSRSPLTSPVWSAKSWCTTIRR